MGESVERLYEQTLILRCQARDTAAFAELVERYHPRLRYYLRKMLGDVHRADDVLQDVWIDVFRALPRLRDPAAFAGWLYRIARDRMSRTLRSLRAGRRVAEGLGAIEVEAPAIEETLSADDADAIHRAMDGLTPEHREALILRFVQELSCEQIAVITNVSSGTVRSRLHYARRAMRRLLERTDLYDQQK